MKLSTISRRGHKGGRQWAEKVTKWLQIEDKKIPVRKSVSLPEGCPESLIPWAVLASPLNLRRARIPAWGNALIHFCLVGPPPYPLIRGCPSCEVLPRGMLTADGMRLF